MRTFLLYVLLLSLCLSAEAKKKHYSSSNTLLTPSHESLLRQNLCGDQMNLQRFQNEDEVQDAVRRGVLIALPITLGLHVAPNLPLSRRYALLTTVHFLLTLSEAYRLRFGKPLVIDSAVRDADTQRRLRKHNRNAAPVDGETASSHETGATVDIAKHGMNRAQLQWMRAMLSYEVVMNRVIVEEERHQACFHTMVLGGTE
jgi:hypothetical protein